MSLSFEYLYTTFHYYFFFVFFIGPEGPPAAIVGDRVFVIGAAVIPPTKGLIIPLPPIDIAPIGT